MTIELLAGLAWKSLFVAGIALLALRLLRRRSAAERALMAHLALLTVVLVPTASLLLPELKVMAPPVVAEAFRAADPAPAAETRFDAPIPVTATQPAPVMRWLDLAATLYLVPTGLLLLLTLVALARLQRLRRRAEVLVDPNWLTALAAAQGRLGMRHGTALLASDEVASPISWGVIRPIIILDRKAAADLGGAEAIIAHELAHVVRLDWLGLLLGRAACALCWFNPLVWALARRAHQLSEQAADDAVLRSAVPAADYAELLVASARHSAPPLALAANGVAPSRDSLGERVVAVLDPARVRRPVRLGWALLCAVGALGLGTAVAATAPKLAGQTYMRGDFAGIAAARLAAIPQPQTQAIARAIRTRNWAARRSPGGTRFSDPRAAEPLILALRDHSPVIRRIAAWGLSELRPREAIAPLARLLDDEDADVRSEAARALGDLSAAGETQAIARLLSDPSPQVRVQAAHALGDLQDPASRPALEAALADPDAGVRAKAGWALRQVSEAEAVIRRYGGG